MTEIRKTEDWINWFFDTATTGLDPQSPFVMKTKMARYNYIFFAKKRNWKSRYVVSSYSTKTEDIKNWCIENCQQKFIRYDNLWWEFESKEDAILFRLTWG